MTKIAARNQNLDKNPNLLPRKKPWTGPIGNWPQNDNIQNNKDTITVGEIFIWKNQQLTQDFLRTKTENERDEIAKDIYNFLIDYDWNNLHFSEQEINKGWKSLCTTQTKPEIIDTNTFISNSSTSGNAIYRHFFPNILKVRGQNRRSIWDALIDKELLWQVIRNRIGNTLLWNDDPNGIPVQYPMKMCLSQIQIGAKNSGLCSMASIYKCALAKEIYRKYVKTGFKVLDYSAGFGTRLLGLMSLQLPDISYYAYEPNTETYDNLQRMIKYFNFNANIKKCGSETELFDEQFDFIFSSPPYFDLEKYSDENEQCYNKYPDYNNWLIQYWDQTVKNIKAMSKQDAVFAINVGGNANEFSQKIEKDMNDIIKNNGYILFDKWWMKTSKSHLSGKRSKTDKVKLEGIFFYRKQQ